MTPKIATSSNTCKVVIESLSRSILNLLNFGANKGNIPDLRDYINNEVYKLCQSGEISKVKQDSFLSLMHKKNAENDKFGTKQMQFS